MPAIDWNISTGLTDYEEAVTTMEKRVAAIRTGSAAELVWLLEHPAIYTAGTSAQPGDLRDPSPFPVYPTGRGGQYTYHGPGQRVAYVLLDLKQRACDVRAYVRTLEDWLIDTLAAFNVQGERRDGRVGIWVVGEGGAEEKIAAIGVRIRRWVTYHGISAQRGAEPRSLSRHRALRPERTRRDLARRARPPHHHGGGGRSAEGELREKLRAYSLGAW